MLDDFLTYIDPGSGALAWQLLVAGTLGVLIAVRTKLFDLFTRFRRKDNNERE
jgi:hypothetical protein